MILSVMFALGEGRQEDTEAVMKDLNVSRIVLKEMPLAKFGTVDVSRVTLGCEPN